MSILKASDLRTVLGVNKELKLSELAQYCNNRSSDIHSNFCVLLGAGASKPSGIRTASELISNWISEVIDLHKDDASFPRDVSSFYTWIKENPQTWYDSEKPYSSLFEYRYKNVKQRRNFIESEVDKKVPSIGYAYLVKLAENHYFRTIFTTNYDDLINEAFYRFSTERPMVCAHDSSVIDATVTGKRASIIKLHGDYLFENIKSTASETQRLSENISTKLREFLREFGLIVSGYSGTDESIMGILHEVLDSDQNLRSGLIWVFREGDAVGGRLLDLLKRDNVYYVLSDGFDELFADLYTALCGGLLPFNSKIASDRAERVIDSYLDNQKLRASSNETITTHLEELEKEKKGSLLVDAITSFREESSDDEDISDSQLIDLLGVQKLLYRRAYTAALKEIDVSLTHHKNEQMCRILLEKKYFCYRMLYRTEDALGVATDIEKLRPDDVTTVLNKCRVTLDNEACLILLEEAIKQAPNISQLHTYYCTRLRKSYRSCLGTKKKIDIERVIEAHEAALKSNPSIANPVWGALFGFVLAYDSNRTRCEKKLESLYKKLLEQDKYGPAVTSLLVRYSKYTREKTVFGCDVFKQIEVNYNKHLPRDYVGFFGLWVDLCLTFDCSAKLANIVGEYRGREDLHEDEEFIYEYLDVLSDHYRNIEAAISVGEGYLKNRQSEDVERALFQLYVANGEVASAQKMLKRLKGVYTYELYIENQAKVLELEGKYQEAIDKVFILSRVDQVSACGLGF
jgi:NAD-dependent SIR2 family protein deacetylase